MRVLVNADWNTPSRVRDQHLGLMASATSCAGAQNFVCVGLPIGSIVVPFLWLRFRIL